MFEILDIMLKFAQIIQMKAAELHLGLVILRTNAHDLVFSNIKALLLFLSRQLNPTSILKYNMLNIAYLLRQNSTLPFVELCCMPESGRPRNLV